MSSAVFVNRSIN